MKVDDFVVFLVDEDCDAVKSMTRLLETIGYRVRAYSSAREFHAANDAATPGCVILDVHLSDLDGVELQTALGGGEIGRPIIFMSRSIHVPVIVKAMKAGAVDFLTKPVHLKELKEAVSAARLEVRQVREQREKQKSALSGIADLTRRERQVLRGVIEGRLNKQIAADLGLSPRTVKHYRGNMMRKIGVRSVAALVRIADRAGLGMNRPAMPSAWGREAVMSS